MVSASKSSDSELTDMLNMLSEEILPKQVRQRAKKLCDELNQLLFLDDMCELAVDRVTLIRISCNESLMPASLRDIAILETSKHLGRRIKGLGKGRRIAWMDGAKYGLPMSKTDLRAIGITETMSIDELGVVLKAQFPKMPKFWINEDSTQLADSVLRKFMVNRTVWDCLVANLGFWAALTVIGSIIVSRLCQ
jgi:hypothetical protein